MLVHRLVGRALAQGPFVQCLRSQPCLVASFLLARCVAVPTVGIMVTFRYDHGRDQMPISNVTRQPSKAEPTIHNADNNHDPGTVSDHDATCHPRQVLGGDSGVWS